jgi:NADPH-dependent 2,4-dienoyl-CoA reductase/sulfur reductase-like enzyme
VDAVAKQIVVVGGVATGPKAAARARRRDPEAQITIVERGGLLSYAGCGMPYYVAGLVEEARDLMCTPAGVLRDAAFFKNVKDVNVRLRTLAEGIDRDRQEVALVNVETGERSKLPYDYLVLATGGMPVVPPISGLDLNRVFRLAQPDDAVAIRQTALSRGVNRVAIIGGGLIGMEVTDALATLGLQVTVVEMMPHVLSALLDPDMASLLENHLRAKGVELRLGERVMGLEGDETGNVRRVVTDRGVIETDMALLAIGVRPNTRLAEEAGLTLGPTKAIAVNEYLQTSDPSIYAGGDCVENTHLVSGRKVYVPMGSTANKHGRIIGDNVTGGHERFPGIVGTTVLKVFEFNVGRTGLTEREAKALGHDVVVSLTPSPDCAHYYPESRSVMVKLVTDARTGKVLGAQALGAGEAVKRIDVVATVLTFGGTVDQLANLDLGYAPPYATAIDVVEHAANVVRNKQAGLAIGLSPQDVKEKLDRGEDFVLLDVRTPKEYEGERIDDPRVRLIPLGRLR